MGHGCGARGLASQAGTREAGGNRPGSLWSSARKGWTWNGRWMGESLSGRGMNFPSRSRKHGPPDRKAAVARLMALRGSCAGVAAGEADREKTTFAPSGAPPPLMFRGAGPQLPSGLKGCENEATWLFEIRTRNRCSFPGRDAGRSAASQNRDRYEHILRYDPGSAAHHAAKSGALRSIRGTTRRRGRYRFFAILSDHAVGG